MIVFRNARLCIRTSGNLMQKTAVSVPCYGPQEAASIWMVDLASAHGHVSSVSLRVQAGYTFFTLHGFEASYSPYGPPWCASAAASDRARVALVSERAEPRLHICTIKYQLLTFIGRIDEPHSSNRQMNRDRAACQRLKLRCADAEADGCNACFLIEVPQICLSSQIPRKRKEPQSSERHLQKTEVRPRSPREISREPAMSAVLRPRRARRARSHECAAPRSPGSDSSQASCMAYPLRREGGGAS